MVLKKRGKLKAKNKENDRLKARERQRKKMIRTRFGQKPKKHAKKGVGSCIFAVAAAVLLVLLISNSFSAKGQVGFWVGIAGLLNLWIAIKGCSYGVKGFRERDKNYITCKIGVGVNAALIVCMCGIFIRGLF